MSELKKDEINGEQNVAPVAAETSSEEVKKDIRWYVIHTYSGYENKVKTDLEQTLQNRDLQDYIFKIVIPMEEQIEIKKGKTKKNLRKVFPGYVLIKMIVTEETWYIVRNTTGVTGFVGAGTKPIPLTTEEIRKMGIDDSVIEVDYEVGDTVEVLSQPLEGYTGQVEEINKDKGKVRVLITMFGRETSVELDFANIQKASK